MKYSFTAPQIEFLSQSLSPIIQNSIIKECLCFNDDQFFLISDKFSLFFSFKNPFLRFHLTTRRPPETKHPINRLLATGIIQSVEVINKDRILRLRFNVKGKSLLLICEFFPKHPNFYVIDQENTILYSLHPVSTQSYSFPPSKSIPKTDQPLLTHEEMEKLIPALERQYHFDQEKSTLQVRLTRQIKKLEKSISQYNEDLIKFKDWEKIQNEAELLKANYGQLKKGLSSIKVYDWAQDKEIAISLDPTKDAQEQLKSYFRKSKKYRTAISHIETQLLSAHQKLESLHSALGTVTNAQSLEELNIFKPKKAAPVSEKKAPPLPYDEYISSAGIKIWVGKNAKKNEILTFSIANGSDYWLHVSGFPGSHVIIKSSDPDPETLQDALQLALHHSQAKKGGEAEVIVTQRKYVSRFGRGQIGKVQISKHKPVYVRADEKRLKDIKSRERN